MSNCSRKTEEEWAWEFLVDKTIPAFTRLSLIRRATKSQFSFEKKKKGIIASKTKPIRFSSDYLIGRV